MTQTTSTSSRSRSSSERLLDRPRGLRVERRGRLVEQQHPRLERQRPGEHRPLLLADRELRAARARRSSASSPARSSSRSTSGSRPARLGGEADVVGDRALEQRRQLRHQHDLAAELERVAVADVGAPVADGPGLGVGEAVEQPQQGRLAGARRPREAGRAGRDPGAELAQHLLAAAREAHPLELEGRSRQRPPCDYRGMAPQADATQPRADAGAAGEGAADRRRLGLEIKWDGIRALTYVDDRGLRIARPPRRRPHPSLSRVRGDRRGVRGPRGDPRRRDRRLRRAGRAELPAPAAAHGPDRPRRRSACARPRPRRPTSPSTCSGSTGARCSPSPT